ncbi:MAG: outer membrane beta-barrel domain-containing protein [Deltaproteobacteria bacterium]|nr:outer membrane beta-barrel domain-containing protein [Deltaproteobacteria bacterium]
MNRQLNQRAFSLWQICAVALILASVLGAGVAQAQELEGEGGELFAIQRRNLLGRHELSAALGTFPMDAFGTGLVVGGAYTFHFSHLIGWEIINGSYSFVLGTGLKEELDKRFEVAPQKEGELIGVLSSNVIIRPLYGKLAVLNKARQAWELFFSGGLALGFFDNDSRPFGVSLGVGLRFFVSKHFSLRFDVRDHVLFPGFEDVSNHLLIGLGGSLSFGFENDDAKDN